MRTEYRGAGRNLALGTSQKRLVFATNFEFDDYTDSCNSGTVGFNGFAGPRSDFAGRID